MPKSTARPERIIDTPEWAALSAHFETIKDAHLRELFAGRELTRQRDHVGHRHAARDDARRYVRDVGDTAPHALDDVLHRAELVCGKVRDLDLSAFLERRDPRFTGT